MFAVIKTGGKQYKVAPGDILEIEKLEVSAGDTLNFDEVLSFGNDDAVEIGAPLLQKSAVHATVINQIRGDKIIVFKKNRRHNYRRRNGHRQDLTLIKIEDFTIAGKKIAAPVKAEKIKTKKADTAPQATVDAAATEE